MRSRSVRAERSRTGRILGLGVGLGLFAGTAGAQTLTTLSSTSPSVPAPTEAQYDAVSPNNVTGQTTTTVVFSTTCTGSGGTNCRLFLALGSNPQGFPLGIQWQIVSTTGGATCASQVTLGTWQEMTVNTIFKTKANDVCTVTLLFRVKDLSYPVHQAPGRNNTTNPYQQQVAFTLTRP